MAEETTTLESPMAKAAQAMAGNQIDETSKPEGHAQAEPAKPQEPTQNGQQKPIEDKPAETPVGEEKKPEEAKPEETPATGPNEVIVQSDDPAQPAASEEAEETYVDADVWVSEETNGEFESFDQMLELARQAKEPVFANEQIQKLNDLALKGIDYNEVMRYRSLGIDNLDPSNQEQAMKILRINAKLEDPDITDRQVDIMLKKKFQLDNEDLSDEDKEYYALQVQSEAKKTKRLIEGKIKELELPKPAAPQAEQGYSPQDIEESRKLFAQDVQQYLSGYDNKETFALDKEGSKLTYVLSDERRKQLQQSMGTPVEFVLNRYYDKSTGQVDMAKYRREMAILNNFDSIATAIYGQGMSKGAEKVASGLKNPAQPSSAAPHAEAEEDPRKQAARQMLGQNK